eukprot:jgi/Ulvmu1/9087/UM005_0182.1
MEPQVETPKTVWTFSTSGWLFVYFFGVLKAMRETGRDRNVYAIGSSGGACVAGLLFVPECSLDDMVDFVGQCCDDCRLSFANRFRVRHYVKQAVLKFCPPDIAARVRDRLEVSVTKLFTWRNIRWKNFESKDEYVDAILASSCAVGIAGLPYRTCAHGLLIDGGFSDLRLLAAMLLGRKFCAFHNGAVVSVCPFYCSRADIRPSRFVNPLWALFPPPKQQLLELYRLGYDDAMRFLKRSDAADSREAAGPAEPTPAAAAGFCSDAHPRAHSVPLPALAHDTASTAAHCAAPLQGDAVMRKLREEATCAHAAAQQELRQAQNRSGAAGLATSWLRAIAWQLIYGEVVLVTYITAALFWILPFVQTADRQAQWKRASFCWSGLFNIRLLLKMLPVVGCSVDVLGNEQFISSLHDVSLLYRLFKYHL